MPLIFQYGSNCNASRLNAPKRLNGAATDLGRAATVGECDLAFDVWSRGNGCAASDLVATPGSGRHAVGVLYTLTDEALARLRAIEGPHYEEKRIRVRNEAGEEVEAVTFVVKERDRRSGIGTTAEYVGHIVVGLRAHGVPEDYVRHVINIALDTNSRAETNAEEQSRLIAALSQPDPASPNSSR